MFVAIIGVVLAAGVIKFVVALCGHQITLRLAAVIALLIALLIARCL